MGNDVIEKFLTGDLSPRSPGVGSTPARPDNPTVQQRRDRQQAHDRARREAGLGRADAGTTGDVDAPDAAVGEGVAYEAMQLREEILAGARAANEAGRPWAADFTAAALARVDGWADRARGGGARAGTAAAQGTGGDDGEELHEAVEGLDDLPEILEDRREDAPPDRRRDHASGNAFTCFLRESGDEINNGKELREWFAFAQGE